MPTTSASFVFLDAHATEFFRDWNSVVNDTVALLRLITHAEGGQSEDGKVG